MDDPRIEYKRISDWVDKQSTKTFTPIQFAKRLQYFLKKRYPVAVKVQHTDALEPTEFTIAGLYDYLNDQVGLPSLIFVIMVNHQLEKKWNIPDIERMKIEVLESLIHEYQHLFQYQARDFLVGKLYGYTKNCEIAYLSNKDEVDAYAANIAARFIVLNTRASSDLDMYRQHFSPQNPVYKRLMKKIFKKIEQWS